jgi:hypothetical protein
MPEITILLPVTLDCPHCQKKTIVVIKQLGDKRIPVALCPTEAHYFGVLQITKPAT